MPPSRLWGRQPREFTDYVYESGQIVGAVTTREREYTAEDVALLLAVDAIDRDKGPYGIPLSEAMDPANQFMYKPPEKPLTNWAEKTTADAIDAYYKANPESSRNGHMWPSPTRRSVTPK